MPARTEIRTTNIPTTDDGLWLWFGNFAQCVADDPGRFRLTAGDGAKLTQLAAAYEESYFRAHAPGTRTTLAIAEKNHARSAALKVFREYANQIKADPTISSADKVALGFK